MRCLVVDDDAMSRAVMEHFITQYGTLTLAASCENAIDAAVVLQQQEIDLVLLDIEMPEVTGLELIRSLTHRPQIILVTSKQKYAVEAFEVNVTDYLLKPVSYARFLKAVSRAHERWQEASEQGEPSQDYVFIKTEGRFIKLDLAAVQWFEAQGDYVMVHTAAGRHLIHSTMKALENKLPTTAFTRVHRSYIVRMDQVEDIKDTTIVIGAKVIPIGASYKEVLFSRLKTLG